MTPEQAGGQETATALRLSPVRMLLAIVSGVLLMIMMLVTVADVIGRYAFNSPLSGATEITALLLSSVIFIGLPAVCLDDEHVTVDLLVDRMPSWFQPIRRAAISLLSSGALAVIAWRLLAQGQAMANYGERTVSLHLPVAPIAYLGATATAVAALITLSQVLSSKR